MLHRFHVEERHFAYLAIQKGGISHLRKDRKAWMDAYNELMQTELERIKPFLPAKCANVLDIGGGLGGINALINKRYGGNVLVEVLDGEADEPVVVLARKPFNSMDVTRDFLRKNGVMRFVPLTPHGIGNDDDRDACDLIVSFGSWCFHYPPSVYLEYVKSRCHADTRLIIDVRHRHEDWIDQLEREFRLVHTMDLQGKCVRKVYSFT